MIRERACLASLAAALCALLAASAEAQTTEDTEQPVEATVAADVEASAEIEAPPPQDTGVATESTTEVELTATAPAENQDEANLAEQLRVRNDIAAVHRAFGIATWVSMAATAVLGWIQFADEYGFHGNENETACANGDAVIQDFCSGVPWAHAIAGFTTAALYFTTAGISFAMPAPLEASADVELHKTLRWFHLATMLATAVFGVVTANVEADFQTRQALAITHQTLGVATFGLLTAAAGVVIF